MRALGLLRKVLAGREVIGHRMRERSLLKASEALVLGAKLSVTMLGRERAGNIEEKHRIKAVDELLRNRHLQRERPRVYREMARRVLGALRSAVIVVDWSDTGRREVRVLRAAAVLEGRALVLWEEAFSEAQYNRAQSHERFLRALHALVPPHLQVVLITDAGFRVPWFRQVEGYAWRWLGRVRNVSNYQVIGESTWQPVRTLYATATQRLRALGSVWLNKTDSLHAHLFLSTRPAPKRPGPRRHAEHYRASRSHREPWLLAASPELHLSAEQAIALYRTRMQIEQTFRDLKNPRHGFGLRYSRSTKPERVAILLLIAALATFALWLAGLAAKAQGWTPRYQANTVKNRRTLSVVFLGARVIREARRQLTPSMLNNALIDLQSMVVPVPVHA